jgi:hypothetical protein
VSHSNWLAGIPLKSLAAAVIRLVRPPYSSGVNISRFGPIDFEETTIMRKPLLMAAIFFLVCLTCMEKGNIKAQRRVRHTSAQSASSGLTLDQQAQRLAEAYWKRRVVKCGDSYYKWGRTAINGPYGLIEMKDISIETSGAAPQPPRTRAEILNEKNNPSGLQWSGQSILSQAAYRFMSPRTRAWERWADGGREVISIQKRNGKWIFPEDEGPISCQAINTFTLKPGAVAVNPPTISDDGTLIFPANYPRWFSLGRGPVRLLMGNPYPQISIDRGPWPSMPHGSLAGDKPYNPRALVPSMMLGVLVAKIGQNGEPFMPFTNDTIGLEPLYINGEYKGHYAQYLFDTDDEIFLAINDYNYTDNRGAYKFWIVR